MHRVWVCSPTLAKAASEWQAIVSLSGSNRFKIECTNLLSNFALRTAWLAFLKSAIFGVGNDCWLKLLEHSNHVYSGLTANSRSHSRHAKFWSEHQKGDLQVGYFWECSGRILSTKQVMLMEMDLSGFWWRHVPNFTNKGFVCNQGRGLRLRVSSLSQGLCLMQNLPTT